MKFFEKESTEFYTEYKLFSHTIYKHANYQGIIDIHKKIDQLIHQNHALTNIILMNMQVPFLHQKTFGPYKNKFAGKTVVLVASGPTTHYYKPIEGAIHVGCNNACLLDNIKLDYLFSQDFSMTEEKRQAIINYRKGECKKFFGRISDRRIQLSHSYEQSKHVRRISKNYIVDADASEYFINELYSSNNFAVDIELQPLQSCMSIVFAAMQFILHAHPAKIYLVGCDCTSGYFYKSDVTYSASHIINTWHECKKFIDEMYPDVDVTSINPVGLKGLFSDKFTEDYLQKGV